MKEAFEFMTKHWKVLTAVVAFISACAVFPFQLKATQDDVKELKAEQKILVDQTTTIGAYIQSEKQKDELEAAHEKEMRDAAPKGMRWDSIRREYVPEKKR